MAETAIHELEALKKVVKTEKAPKIEQKPTEVIKEHIEAKLAGDAALHNPTKVEEPAVPSKTEQAIKALPPANNFMDALKRLVETPASMGINNNAI